MTRPRHLRVWGVALWAVCLLALSGGHPGGAAGAVAQSAPVTVAGVLSPVAHPAVMPPRVIDEVRAATSGAPLRLLVLAAAALAVLVGLPAALRRRSSTDRGGPRALRARRYTIALRAPPLQLA